MSERYFLLKGFFPETLIKYCEEMCNKLQQHDSKVGGTVQKDKKRRKDVYLNSAQCAPIDEFFFAKRDYFEQLLGVKITYRETYRIGIYDSSDKGFSNPHTDTQGGMEHRKFSAVACLSSSNDYTGGLLKFIDLDKSFKFDRGDTIVFDPKLMHGVEPVESGNRKVLISFMWDINGESRRANRNTSNIANYTPNLRKPPLEHRNTKPNENGTSSNENGTSSNENGTSSNENGNSSNENGNKPNENGTKPNENGTKSNENGTKSNENGTSSNENGTGSNENVT